MHALRCTYLIAGDASWLERFGVVPATVDKTVLVEVDEVNEQLDASDAHKTRRMPADIRSSTRRENR